MKDATHHLRNVQRKILRLSRKEELENNKSINDTELERVASPERRNPKFFISKKMKAQYQQ